MYLNREYLGLKVYNNKVHGPLRESRGFGNQV